MVNDIRSSEMRPRTWFIIAIGLSAALIGCKPSTLGPAAVYSKVTLGMPFNEAKSLIDGESEERSYDNLPSFPKPREIYSKLPISTEWRIWSGVGKPTLILG